MFIAPSYLCDCLLLYTPSRTHLRSASYSLSLHISRTRLSTFGSCAFSVLGPSTGNDLPFLSDRNPLWTPSDQTEGISFPKTIDLPCFPFRAALFLPLKSLFVVRFNCVQIKFCVVSILVCTGACVYAYVRVCA